MISAIVCTALAAVIFGTAVAVVTTDNLVHSVFWLAAMLLGTAALYVHLASPFLAAIQVLLYTGGVITMMLFGVMLTHRDPGKKVPNVAEAPGWAAPVALGIGGTLVAAIWTTPELAALTPIDPGTANQIGAMFLDRYLVAFEVLSVLLLAGMIGAIVLARRTDA